jgi:molybdopterin/thiamine biosynthesis adenylyltransferase
MILSKEQINRYLRHIIIPEISGPGQKKITESKVYLYASTVQEASSLIYYLAASGIGYIYCNFKDNVGYEDLFNNISDLNCDVIIELFCNQLKASSNSSLYNEGSVFRIFISNYENLKDNLINFSNSIASSAFIPTILSINSGWKGFLQTFTNKEALNNLFSNPLPSDLKAICDNSEEKEGPILSASLLGPLAAIECIKLILEIGTTLEKPLYFNLLSMEFYKSDNMDFELAIANFLENSYSDNQLTEASKRNDTTKKLSESKVLIVGAGGLGSPVSYALTSLGVGTIGIVDYDSVEISNLNRQILHSISRINMTKVESAKIFLNNLNPKVKIVTHSTSLNISNALDIIEDYDVIIDALDNFPARYLLNDACYFKNKPLVDAAAVRFHGLIMTILPNKGPCYRCAFPVMANQKPGTSCSEAGVLGPVPGVMGFLQAAQVVKLLIGKGMPLSNRIIYYDALYSDFDTISIDKSTNCDLCGSHPTITTLTEYNNSCETNKNKGTS